MTTRRARMRVAALILATACAQVVESAVTCNVSSAGVAFGVYDPLSGAPLDSSGVISVTCSITYPPFVDTVNYTVDLSPGGGSYLARRMQSGVNQLNYNLYTASTRTVVWGDDSGSTDDVAGSMTIGFFFWPQSKTNTHTIYGRITQGQDVAPGNYLDTIVVTVTY